MTQVKGHYRNIRGKQIWIKPHSRNVGSRPRLDKRMLREEARLRKYFPEARIVK